MEPQEFRFDDDNVAASYDEIIVTFLFESWSTRLVEEHGPWEGLHVLDLATGTGIVAQKLAEAVGKRGRVIGADLNPQMLEFATKRCKNASAEVQFVECSADSLAIPDDTMNTVVCQQGFQFFPDKLAAAKEVARVLKQNGKFVATTWLPVTECDFIGAICDALLKVGEPDICNAMRIPFDQFSGEEFAECVAEAGLVNIDVRQQREDLILEGGMTDALKMVYATPIGPMIRALPEAKQEAFRQEFTGLIQKLTHEGIVMGSMATNLLLAEKAS